MTKPPSTVLPAMKLCEQFGCNRRTLDRWLADESLGFPEPLVIHGRLYFDQDKIEAWKRQRATVSRRQSKRVKTRATAEQRQTAA